MEDYGEEVRTPPVTLVSIVGGDHQLQTTILTHLHSQQPPINTLALPDFSTTTQLLRSKSNKNDDEAEDHNQLPSEFSKTGIIKRDWISKHRTKVPAVVACLFDAADLLLANNPNHPFIYM